MSIATAQDIIHIFISLSDPHKFCFKNLEKESFNPFPMTNLTFLPICQSKALKIRQQIKIYQKYGQMGIQLSD